MSKSVLQGAKFRGLIKVSEDGLVGMISLRCDLKSVAVARGVRAALGLDLPDVRAIVYGRGGRRLRGCPLTRCWFYAIIRRFRVGEKAG